MKAHVFILCAFALLIGHGSSDTSAGKDSDCKGEDALTLEESCALQDWEIPLDEFSNVVDNGGSVVIDVREPHEVENVRVDAKEYLNIPLGQLENALDLDSSDFQSLFHADLPQKSDEIIFICRSGKRSNAALEIARKKKFKNARHFGTGTLGWMEFSDKFVRSNKEEL